MFHVASRLRPGVGLQLCGPPVGLDYQTRAQGLAFQEFKPQESGLPPGQFTAAEALVMAL